MHRARVALAGALAVLALAIGLSLSQGAPTVAAANGVPPKEVAELTAGGSTCGEEETVPRGTSAIRVSLEAGVGPWVKVVVFSGSHVVTEGEHPSGWGLGTTVLVHVKPVAHTVRDALVCTTLGKSIEPVIVQGAVRAGISRTRGFRTIELRLEYLRPGASSWWSLASTIARRMRFGRAASGIWWVFLALALMLGVSALVVRVAFRELR
jgi:hypothetical protein